MVRTFVLTPNLPYPPRSGADLRTLSVIRALSRLGPVGVFGIGRTKVSRPPLENVERWVTTTLDAASSEDSSGGEARWITDPEWTPSDRYFSEAIDAEVLDELTAFAPDLVVLEQLVVAGYLRSARSTGAVVVLDDHNVESELHDEMARGETSGVRRMVRKHFSERVRRLELDTLEQVDGVWACSVRDASLLEEMDKPALIGIVPNGIDPQPYISIPREESTEPTLLFPANFGYEPNAKAATYIAKELLPRVSERWPSVKFALPGRDPQPELVELCREAGAHMPGAVADMLPYFAQASAMTIPLFEGGGTRLKVLEAFAVGLPVISTSKGVEGLDVEPDVHYLLADSTPDFVDAIGRVLEGSPPDAKAARLLVEDRYSQAAVDRAVENAVLDLGFEA